MTKATKSPTVHLSTRDLQRILDHLDAVHNSAQLANEAAVECEEPAEPHSDPRRFERNMARLFASAKRAHDVWSKATGRKVV